jgi:tetratricopeptide (TPR) repeat protein
MMAALKDLAENDRELKSVCLIRIAIIERHAGRLKDALTRLNEVAGVAKVVGPWATGRYHLEVATTLKNIGVSDSNTRSLRQSIKYYQKALHEFEAVGNHRYAAIVENNHGYLLLGLNEFNEAEKHLLRARSLFDSFGDKACRAQVDETLARLHLAEGRLGLAQQAVERAVDALETGDGDVLLAEALVTRGLVLCRMGRHREAKRILERGNQLAERCGDLEGAGRALLVMVEEMLAQLGDDERNELVPQLRKFLGNSQLAATRERLGKCLKLITTPLKADGA